MYWSMDSDLRNEAVARGMSRNKFRDILRNLHFVNNGQLPPGDKFAKVRPLIDHLNSVFLKYIPLTQNTSISVDESMVPYYSHHSCKQRIKGKPIRYGFKFWSENVSNGYLVNTEPYQGKGTFLSDSELGLGASVVSSTFANRLKENFPDQKFDFFIDNFFTGLPLIKKLSALDYGCTGTIRQNRRRMKKSLRGSMDSYVNSTKDVIVMQWKDNSIVHVASNCFDLHPTKTARRYSAAEKKYILVEMPHAIQQYNNHMCGTDLMNRNTCISNYRPQLRNNKWWWQVFIHLLCA
nr:unnamed protein product [Callosobruchus analis]